MERKGKRYKNRERYGEERKERQTQREVCEGKEGKFETRKVWRGKERETDKERAVERKKYINRKKERENEK